MKKYWKSIEEYKEAIRNESGGSALESKPQPEFSVEGLSEEEKIGGTNRRDFLKMLGFTVGYAALASSCEMPVRKAIPYLNQPEEITPGVANYYASTFFDGYDFCNIVIKVRDGRPIKIEGNELSKINGAGTIARVQASVLSLYDLARLQSPMKNQQAVSWNTIDNEIPGKLKEISNSGKKIVILSPTVISPSTKKAIARFTSEYPDTEWIVYDTLSSSAMLDANEKNFGVRAIPAYHFDKAGLIVGFNADFLGTWISPAEYTRQYARGRKISEKNKSMSKHIQYESYMSLTGSNADYRFPILPSEELVILKNLYNEIAEQTGATKIEVTSSKYDVVTIASELLDHKGNSLVISGTNDTDIQLTVNAINHLLDNYGQTVDLSRPVFLRQGDDRKMEKMVGELNEGNIGGIIFYNTNPVYDYYASEKLFEGLKKAELTVSLSEVMDETARACKYVCPDSHYLESWNDAEPSSGNLSIQQPGITKLFDTRQAQESLLAWAGVKVHYHDFIRSHWEETYFPQQDRFIAFDSFWKQSVHDGVTGIETGSGEAPEFTMALPAGKETKTNGLELVLYEKVSIGNGKHANNPWLQELPDPISSATWDNYVCVAHSDAEEMGLSSEDVVKIDGQLELPVLVQPGQPKGTIGIAVGYGRTSAGRVAEGIGKNVYHLSHVINGERRLAGKPVTMERAGRKTYPLARTQSHHTMEGRAIVRETTLPQWKEDPKSGNEMHRDIVKENLTLYEVPKFDGYHWGMAINLNACTGCGNCAIACQAENNVAVIGKEEVRNRRIMHWLRIDRYYSEEVDNPEVTHMPVMCQHCDNAPCENVCPVAATPHSSEGLNQMAYNRCIGTRYCMNNCPYKVRRFNWYEYSNNKKFDYNLSNDQEKLVLNPDVTVRSRGVVEKCSLCVQRIQEKKLQAKKEGRPVMEGEIKTACQQSCPGDAIVFGNLNDPEAEITKVVKDPRTYQLLEQLHTLPTVSYVTKVRNMDPEDKKQNYSIQYPVFKGSGDTEPGGSGGPKH